MSIFYAIVEGDPLDTGNGSWVIGGADHATIADEQGRARRQTHLGHEAWCGVCKSFGAILAGAAIRESLRGWDERLSAFEAVDGDIVLCKCERHPRVMSVYARSVMYVDNSGGASIVSTSATSSAARNTGYDQRFRIVNPRTGQPLTGTPYYIATEDGDELDGYTDSQGYTQPVTSTQAISATLHVLEEVTPIDPDWDKGLQQTSNNPAR